MTRISSKGRARKACLEEAGRRFTQACHTPFLSPPLIYIFGEYGNPKEVSKVLAGTFITPPKCDPYAAKFLSVMTQPCEDPGWLLSCNLQRKARMDGPNQELLG